MNFAPSSELKPLGVVITGTHSAGKSTVIRDIEQGKLVDLDIHHPEYDDFGYGLMSMEEDGLTLPYVTVPESARWLAVDIHGRPDLLAENYNLPFQLSIDAETIFRYHAAAQLIGPLLSRMADEQILDSAGIIQPAVITDRGPLDGVTYSELRCDEDTNIINGSPRTGFQVEWLRSFIDIVAIADHEEIPFEFDGARLEDTEFRDTVAGQINDNYLSVLGYQNVTQLKGSRLNRIFQLFNAVSACIDNPDRSQVTSIPYYQWSSIRLPLAEK